MLKSRTEFFKILECIKVVKYAVKLMCIIMISSVCSIAYKNITIYKWYPQWSTVGFTVKTNLWNKMYSIESALLSVLKLSFLYIYPFILPLQTSKDKGAMKSVMLLWYHYSQVSSHDKTCLKCCRVLPKVLYNMYCIAVQIMWSAYRIEISTFANKINTFDIW